MELLTKADHNGGTTSDKEESVTRSRDTSYKTVIIGISNENTMQLRPHQNEALAKMRLRSKGQVIVPTGGGKTMCMIEDAMNEFSKTYGQTIVVVAPRILLANQLSSEFLEFIDNAEVLHVHSGETHHYSTTKASEISVWSAKNSVSNQIIFTTYHSLHRVQESDIHVDTIYFDEAHNSVQKNFYPATEYFSFNADRCYFFTATPKHSRTPEKAGMNHTLRPMVM